jgi:hypothetical protein
MGRPNGVACGQPGPAVRASAFTGFTAFAGFVPASSVCVRPTHIEVG